ncbi:MAG: prephenate dehydratase [Rhodobacteraceae bacterium]|nr:prephenate dehydratase [Paracoccaceae bacterium]
MINRIAFQGEPGAYSHQACLTARPDHEPLPCETFEDTIAAVNQGKASLAMLPIENSIYGRVADIHHLLPSSNLSIVDELLLPVRIMLLGPKGTGLSTITTAYSHAMLLGQCRRFLRDHGIRPSAWVDTAGAARHVAELRDPSACAIASELAGKIHRLEILERHIEDEPTNRTRFAVMAPALNPNRRADHMITAFVFQVRNIPAALYKSLGGFATNGVNMIKLESYMIDGSFSATQFYAEIEGHPDDKAVNRAMDELAHFTSTLTILGVFPASPERQKS